MFNDCGHATMDGAPADLGDGRERVLCARCRGTLRPPDVKFLDKRDLEKASTACPACPKCNTPAGTRFEAPVQAGELICAACGHVWTGSADELAKAAYADAAYDRLLSLEGVDADEHDRGVA